MPTYSYKCEACGEDFDKFLSRISMCDDPQDCPSCGEGPAKKVFAAGGVGFILKGDGWSGKNHAIKRQMAQKNRRLASKKTEILRDAPSVTLAPNVDGERVGSWSDASKLAKSKGKNTSGYDKRAQKEKKG